MADLPVSINEARLIWRQVGGRSGANDVTGDPVIFEKFHNEVSRLILERVNNDAENAPAE